MQWTRRQVLLGTGALVAQSALAETISNEPKRLARKDCFFGVHFDIHPTAEDKELGHDVTEGMIASLLTRCRPDFVQYDSKGHPGYLGFPSHLGMSAPGIVNDSLAVWRRITAQHGVALYNHFSGVIDKLAVQRHPEWARVDPNGKPDTERTSLFGPYEQQLMLPELIEVAKRYQLDGTWVDGDCWGVEPDYTAASAAEFRKQTGTEALPKTPADPGWNEFLEIQRAAFRRYVETYVDALHREQPGYQITSNWMYSVLMPERPAVAVDFLSGDVAGQAPVYRARQEARYFAQCGKTWDLMTWGFEYNQEFQNTSLKPVAAMQQEAAVVIAQGGAYQLYYSPTRAGYIDDRIVKAIAEVAKFCRERQRWSHRSESVAEVGVLFSGRTLYRTGGKVFGEWPTQARPAEGSVDLLLQCGYSVDLVPDWLIAEVIGQYPVMVLPDWTEIGSGMVEIFAQYVAGGGKLLLCGPENVHLFAKVFDLKIEEPTETEGYYAADDSGFASLEGGWQRLRAAEADVLLRAFAAQDARGRGVPFAVRVGHGSGTIVVCPAPFMSNYALERSPVLRANGSRMMAALKPPLVHLGGNYPFLEFVLRRKDGHLLLHVINASGAAVRGEFRHTGIVPPTGPLQIVVSLPSAPTVVVLEPQGTLLHGEFSDGAWRGTVPDLHVHAIVRFSTHRGY